jgi:hypothetical protein
MFHGNLQREELIWISEGNAMTKAKRVALYVRVSTNGQTVENQRREL